MGNEGLIVGITLMVRKSLADKATFQLAADVMMVNKGPTVKDVKDYYCADILKLFEVLKLERRVREAVKFF